MDVEFLRYQFEDGRNVEGVAVQSRFKIGIRHVQMIYMLLAAASLGAIRGSTAVAVFALTDHARQNNTYFKIQDWDHQVQGTILSSFLFGYALMLIPAELYLRRVEGKHVMSFVLVVSGALTVAMPTIVVKGGLIALCNALLILGALQACLAPANQNLLIKFLPPKEKNVFSFIVHSGTILGIVIALPISGLLTEARLGWELVFYSQAILITSVATLWVILTAKSPDSHPAMGDSEKEFIKEALGCFQRTSLQIPWHSILRSHQFWSTVCAHAASNSVFVLFLFYTPAYLQMFGLSLKDSCLQALPLFISLWFLRVSTAPTIDWLCRTLQPSFYFNLTYLRKVVNVFGACGVIAGLTILPNLTPGWPRIAIVVLTATLGAMGFQYCGFLEAQKDMSEIYRGTLMTISRAVASVVAAFVPVVVGLMLEYNMNSPKGWRLIFLSIASLYLVCNGIYIVFGSSERQYWDGIVEKKFGYHNTMLDTNMEMEELYQTKKPAVDIDIVNTTI